MTSVPETVNPLGAGRRTETSRRAVRTGLVLARHTAAAARRTRGRRRDQVIAQELRRAFEDLGPTYVKLAQLVASSPGLFPEALATEFRACLDAVAPVSIELVRSVIEAELGATVEELYRTFDAVPLASASIAQVHAATLHDGTRVVVKVQRPGLTDRLRADVAILARIARLLDRLSATGRMANPTAVVEDFAITLSSELNFVTEARSMERFDTNLRSFGSNENVRIPAVDWRLTTPRVLTMERIEGYKIDDLAALGETGWDLAAVLKAAVRAWMEAALVHGFFHGDVHAGNLMLDTDGRVVFLDFGICGALDDTTRAVVCDGLPALLVDQDFERVASAIYDLGAILSPADLEQSAKDIAELVSPILERPLSEISYGEVLVDIIKVGTRYDVRLPRELVLVAKQLLYFERYAKLMAPDWTILDDPDLIAFLFESSLNDGSARPPSP
ncbi:MAG TPA: AarF/UbiB family protein [Acidimicrobiales bacterium]|jgi:predicted unusual protein kinase regulating ubiquinone biosynthesis (AarF/ABC1/UbiB family)|nr:AarF/UbiB family protein [Acidimicrobiales bacterium]